MKKVYRQNLIYFGYIKHPNEENSLAFFEYDDLTDEDLMNYN